MVTIDLVSQDETYACICFEVGGWALLRVGPADNRWYAEVSSVRKDYLIYQDFETRDEAAAHAMRLYEKVVVGGDSSFR